MTARIRPATRAAAFSLLASLWLAGPGAGSTPAPGGRELLARLEDDGLGVVGRVTGVERLDVHGYRATVEVERVLGARGTDDADAAPLEIAWEELAASRPVRFEAGEHVLVVLAPLPDASIWTRRIPDAERRAHTLAVAARGAAFLRSPAPGTLDLLHHYLSLPPDARQGPGAVARLAGLTAGAPLPLAGDAAQRLAEIPELSARLTPAARQALVEALLREDATPELVEELLAACASARSSALAAQIARATSARESSPPPARIFEALAVASPDGLGAADVRWLSQRDDPALRRVAARHAQDPTQLRALLADDPDGAVRAAALDRLVERVDAAARPDALAALTDPAPEVRSVAARRSAAPHMNAVPALTQIAFDRYPDCCSGSSEARAAAVAGLGMAGPAGRPALAAIAHDHPDPDLRKLAELALGELREEDH